MTLARFRPDIVHAHSTFAGVAARLLGPLFRARVIYCPHGWAMDREQPNYLRHFYTLVERGLEKLTTHFVAVSEHERQRGIRAGLPPEKITTVHNGLRSNVPAHESTLWDYSRLKVLFVGRLDRDKGIDVLLNASQLLKHKVVVRVIGGAVIEELSVNFSDYPHAEFLGWLDAPSILPHMASCDVVVVPSRWEGFGYVAAEAMRLGKAVIATRVGGLVELVVDKETGFLFPSEDSKALAGILSQVDKSELQEMGAKGRDRFLKHFTASRMAQAIIHLYGEIKH
ncbi:MAG: glycosyltransferase [Bdellovibrionales bacterium]